jgi:fluoride exporter
VIKILVVGAGGFLGAIFRYLVSGLVQNISGSVSFPAGTLAVNLLGCVLIGVLSKISEDWGVFSMETRLFLFIGFLGAFTTYSTFGNETLNLLRDDEWVYAMLYVGLHLVLGIGGVWLGRAVAP